MTWPTWESWILQPAVGKSRDATRLKNEDPQKVQELTAPGILQVKVNIRIKTAEVMYLPKPNSYTSDPYSL